MWFLVHQRNKMFDEKLVVVTFLCNYGQSLTTFGELCWLLRFVDKIFGVGDSSLFESNKRQLRWKSWTVKAMANFPPFYQIVEIEGGKYEWRHHKDLQKSKRQWWQSPGAILLRPIQSPPFRKTKSWVITVKGKRIHLFLKASMHKKFFVGWSLFTIFLCFCFCVKARACCWFFMCASQG